MRKRNAGKIEQISPEAKNSRALVVILILNLILAVCLIVSRYDATQDRLARGHVETIDTGWTIVEGPGAGEGARELPILADKSAGRMVLERTLPIDGPGLYLNLDVNNAAIRVYVDGELCYENGYIYLYGNDDSEVISVFGSELDTVELPELSGETVLRLVLQPSKTGKSCGLNHATLSHSGSVINASFRRSVVAYLCTFLTSSCVIVVLVLHFISVYARRRNHAHLLCTLLGVFLAIHASAQIKVLQTIYGNRYFFILLSALTLTLLPPVMLSFYCAVFVEGKCLHTLRWLASAGYAVALLESGALILLGAVWLSYIRKLSFILLAISAAAVLAAFFIRRVWETPEGRVRMVPPMILLVTLAFEAQRLYIVGNVSTLSGWWVIGLTAFYTFITVVGVVTEIQAHMQVLRDSEQKAIAASKAKSAFLANMSHEIRTPINAILGMDEMILRESAEPATLSYADDISSAGRTLLSLINDILDFSKVEEGKMEIVPTQYDLSSVINDLSAMILSRAEEKGLRFETHVDESTPHLLYGDEIRIRQCALNILTNAVKYTEKGSVTLEIGFKKLSEENISLRFSVTDTGIGMKEEDMERLFSPFTRFEEERNRKIEGTGLGMGITRQLLTLMGSSLEVHSVYGEGSTISFSIEQKVVNWDGVGRLIYGDRQDTAKQSGSRELFHAPDARVLVVDDTPVNLTVIRGLLKRTRIQVDTAESGAEALRKAAEGEYDVILLDHMMPKMDGVETLHELRKLPGLDNVPCVALTANAISGAREWYLAEGFSDYLSKPVDGKKLEKMLQSYLPANKLREPEAPVAKSLPDPGEPSVLIIDDDELVCRLAGDILGKSFHVESCQNGAQAVKAAAHMRPDLILLDINLGDRTGFDVLRELHEDPATDTIPVVFLTGESDEKAEIDGFRGGAADFVRKPFVPEVLLQRTKRIITLDRLQRSLQDEVTRQTLRAERLTTEMMLALSKTVDAKDHYTNGHSERVAAYSAEIARRMGKSPREQEHIYEMGLMHDIGKIGVPEDIINKTSHLTEEEFGIIRRHTVVGSEILHLITEMPELAIGARSHHERYDGTGYPDGLKGTDIPEAARIICVADCYDAMTSTRTYSTPRPQAKVRAEIVRCAGTQFDPEIAQVMLRMIDEDTNYTMNERKADIHVWKGSSKLWSLDRDVPEAAPREPSALRAGEDDVPLALPDWLSKVEGLDTESGLLHCGTAETYLDTLTIYAKDAETTADTIERFWNEDSTADAVVKIHALKSTSRAIGAEGLGALAEKLEHAGKAGDTQTVSDGLGGLLEQLRALSGALSPLYAPAQPEQELPAITEDKLREAYAAIRLSAENMDSEGAEVIFRHLRGFKISDGERERVEQLEHAISEFDWDLVEDILN